MEVRWSYEGVSYRHTADEVDDPEFHSWQEPMATDELIVHAANLHLFRTGQRADRLWSLRGHVAAEEPRRVVQ